jgi:uncharacterized protein YecE (DUF72 family)
MDATSRPSTRHPGSRGADRPRAAVADRDDHAIGDIRIGISGWTYTPWRGDFFPRGLKQRQELGYASAMFRAIEINGTFYRLQRPAAFGAWFDATPADFMFTVKGPRFITHIRRLRDIEAPLANFLASGLLRLGFKLGPLLWQFPPNFRFEPERLRAFLSLLPRDTEQAVTLASQHDGRLKGDVWLATDQRRPLRHAIEIRHESFRDPAFIELLREQNVALVCADTVHWPRLFDITAGFAYCRLHGSRELYRSGYNAADLDLWADRARDWAAGNQPEGDHAGAIISTAGPRDVFIFFDNTDKRHAPKNARGLMRRLGQAVPSRRDALAWTEAAKHGDAA